MKNNRAVKTVLTMLFCVCLLLGFVSGGAQAGSKACYANRFEVKVTFEPSAGGESVTHTFAAIDDVTVDSTPSATMYLEAGVHYWMEIEYSAPSAPGYQAKLLDIAAPTFSETSGVGTMHYGMSTFKSPYISDYANSGSGTWSVKNDRYGRFEMTVALDGVVSGRP